jgi:hypothetical protein
MTIQDYLVVMTTVGIANLKAHLSEHLQAVRRGETVVVVRLAKGSVHDLPLLGPTLGGGGDVLVQLDQERSDRL